MPNGDSWSGTSPLLDILTQRRQYGPQAQEYQQLAQNPTPLPWEGQGISDILPPLQTEITRSRQELPSSIQGYLGTRAQERGQLESGLLNTLNQGLTASIPGIEDRLQSLGILQSGAYPEAIARQRSNLLASSVLPQLSAFDIGTFDTASQLPLQGLQREQGLRTGSIGRGFGLEDISSQQAFQRDLADKMAQQQQLQSILGLIPGLLGIGGLPGLLGGMGGIGGGMGGSWGGGAGGGGGLGGIGGGGGIGSLLGGIMQGRGGGLGGLLGGGGGGAMGAYLGDKLGIGSGWGGALGGLLGGGGLGGALGGGLGGTFGGDLGAGIGGALGAFGQPYAQDWLKSIYNDWSAPSFPAGDLSGSGLPWFDMPPAIPNIGLPADNLQFLTNPMLTPGAGANPWDFGGWGNGGAPDLGGMA